VALPIGAYINAFQTNGQTGHTCVGPKKLRWLRARASEIRPCLETFLNYLQACM